jgi:hypothetical protein
MAKGKKTGGRNFAVGNKYGCGKKMRYLPSVAKDIRGMEVNAQADIKRMLTIIMNTPPSQYKKVVKEFQAKAKTMLEVTILKILNDYLKDGDERKLAFIYEQWKGKPKYEATVNGFETLKGKPGVTVTLDDVIDDIRATDTMTDLAKNRAIADIVYRKRQLELSSKMSFTIDEFVTGMRSAILAAQQTLAKSPKALEKFTTVYTNEMKKHFSDRLIETNPTNNEKVVE